MWPYIALLAVAALCVIAAAKKDARLTVSINKYKKISNEEIEHELK